MRILIVNLLLLSPLLSKGQPDHIFTGKYTYSFAFYSFTLTLKDSGRYLLKEHSDVKDWTYEGNWNLNNHQIDLFPTSFTDRSEQDTLVLKDDGYYVWVGLGKKIEGKWLRKRNKTILVKSSPNRKITHVWPTLMRNQRLRIDNQNQLQLKVSKRRKRMARGLTDFKLHKVP